MLSNLLQAVTTAIDTIMIGQLGPTAIAAVGMGNTVRFFILVLVLSVAGGAISLVAQAKGNRNKEQVSFVTRQSLVSGLILALFLGTLGILLAHPLLSSMDQGGNEEVINLGTAYLQILFLGTPFLVLNIVSNRLMQGAGDTFTPLVLTIGMLGLNIVFNYLFIFGWGPVPAMGVVGASIGTILSRGITAGIAIYLFMSGKNVIHILAGSWRPNRAMVKDILAIGVPSGIQGVFRRASNLIIIGLATATSLGTYGAAVLAIGAQIEQLIVQPIVGMNVAGTSIIGQALGKWQVSDAIKKGNLLIVLAIIVMILLTAPAWWYGEEILLIFDPSAHPTIKEGGISYFNLTLWSLPIGAVNIILTGILRGAGDTRPAMYSAILNRNFLQLITGWLLAFPLGLGFAGIWWGIFAGRTVDSIYMYTVWMRKKWLMVALKKSAVYRIHLHLLPKEAMNKFLREIRTPLMVQTGMEEIVEKQQVIYQKGDKQTIVVFTAQSFSIKSDQ